MAATTAEPMGSLPSGLGICTTAPDIFYLPELVSGQCEKTKQFTLNSVMSDQSLKSSSWYFENNLVFFIFPKLI